MAIEWNKVIVVIVIVSIVLILLPSLFKNGQFDVSKVSDLGSKVNIIWKIVLIGLATTVVYTLVYKYKEKGAWSKKDFFILFIVGIIIYFIWSKILSPMNIDILTQSAGTLQSIAGQLP